MGIQVSGIVHSALIRESGVGAVPQQHFETMKVPSSQYDLIVVVWSQGAGEPDV